MPACVCVLLTNTRKNRNQSCSCAPHPVFFAKKNVVSVSNLTLPNADPNNMNLLRVKHPEAAHPTSDPVRVSSILWPRPQALEEYWTSDPGVEFLESGLALLKYVNTSGPR